MPIFCGSFIDSETTTGTTNYSIPTNYKYYYLDHQEMNIHYITHYRDSPILQKLVTIYIYFIETRLDSILFLSNYMLVMGVIRCILFFFGCHWIFSLKKLRVASDPRQQSKRIFAARGGRPLSHLCILRTVVQ